MERIRQYWTSFEQLSSKNLNAEKYFYQKVTLPSVEINIRRGGSFKGGSFDDEIKYVYDQNIKKAQRGSVLKKAIVSAREAYIYELEKIKTFSPHYGAGIVLKRDRLKVISILNGNDIVNIFYIPSDDTETIVASLKFQ